jgi:hypothetical protein
MYRNNDVPLQAFLQHLQLIASSAMYLRNFTKFACSVGLMRHGGGNNTKSLCSLRLIQIILAGSILRLNAKVFHKSR